VSIKERAFNDQCVKYFKNDGGQAIRGYLAASGGVTQQFGQCLEAGFENLRLEPG
jgi:hypothetical protein